MTERSSYPSIEIDVGGQLTAMAFTADGKHLVGSDWEKVRVWRVEDGAHVATMETGPVFCLAVSKNGRWLAAGTLCGDVLVWSTTTYEKVLAHIGNADDIHAVDFSPADSTRLLVAQRSDTTVSDFISCKQVQILRHNDRVIAAKYSPNGEQIATATRNSVRVWDSDDGGLLVEIPVTVVPLFNTGLVWFQNSHILVVSESMLPPGQQHRNGHHAVTLWDSSTHCRLALGFHRPRDISSVARSPRDRSLAICGDGGKITIQTLSHISDPVPLSRLQCTFQELDIQLHNVALDPCQHAHLANEEALLTAAIHEARNSSAHTLASRALIRVRLQQWEAALIDAEMAIDIQPSVMGFVAKSVAHAGVGEMQKAYNACDLAFEHFHSSHGAFLLLVKSIIISMAEEHRDAINNLDKLIAADPVNSTYNVVQANMHLLLGNLLMEKGDNEGAVHSFDRARTRMRHHANRPLSVVSLISGWKFESLGMTVRQRLCEALYAAGRVRDASESLLEMVITFDEEVYSDPIIKWVLDFAQKCLSVAENEGDPIPLLREWVKTVLIIGEWKGALMAAGNFKIPRGMVYKAVCAQLEMSERIIDAVGCFRGMTNELGTNLRDEHQKWAHCFGQRSIEKLVNLGDTAADAQRYDDAISHYTTALSLNPPSLEDILIKRGRAFIITESWNQAFDDAKQVITLNPSSPWGYKMKHAALHKAGDYDNAVVAFETMLAKMEESPDADIRRRRRQYKTPAKIRAKIHRVVRQTMRDSPHLLINTATGELYDRDQRAALFESLPVFHELVSSMTTRLDRARIRHEVRQYFQYVVLSHRWEDNEPLFDDVVKIAVYDLNQSPTHDKLQMFCKVVHDAGFNWAWSDTCCIKKSDHFVMQESLVAMFKWYRGSAMMVVFLRGVCSSSPPGALACSVWNTRGWTLQEYIAARNIRFYTEDWTLYRDLPLSNHKESMEIITEMEQATRVPAQQLMALRPGLTSIREKLRLASTRKMTRVEDVAYSLLGIFSTVGFSAIYGEGEDSLGRLLANVLTRSGDVSILAWTGEPGHFNSGLPARITVFRRHETSHLPSPVPDAEMERIVRHPSLDIDAALRLYDFLEKLPTPRFAESRMTLPCIAFQLPSPSLYQTRPTRVFRVNTDVFGTVEIKTRYDISRMGPLHLVHPWLDTLLERETKRGGTFVDDHVVPPTPIRADDDSDEESDEEGETATEEDGEGDEETEKEDDEDDEEPEPPSRSAPVHTIPMDRETRARRLAALLRQPFGALLLVSTGRRAGDYRRVAPDSSITVRFREDVSLDDILEHACALDVL